MSTEEKTTGNLRDRCLDFLNKQRMRAITRTGDPTQDLIDFVLAEKGRVPELDGAVPLVLYFGSKEDADELVRAVHDAKPGMIVRHSI